VGIIPAIHPFNDGHFWAIRDRLTNEIIPVRKICTHVSYAGILGNVLSLHLGTLAEFGERRE